MHGATDVPVLHRERIEKKIIQAVKHSLRNKTGRKQKVPVGVGRAFRDYNCAKQFSWTVDQIDHTPAARLNRMLIVDAAITDEQNRIQADRNNKLNRARKARKGRR